MITDLTKCHKKGYLLLYKQTSQGYKYITYTQETIKLVPVLKGNVYTYNSKGIFEKVKKGADNIRFQSYFKEV